MPYLVWPVRGDIDGRSAFPVSECLGAEAQANERAPSGTPDPGSQSSSVTNAILQPLAAPLHIFGLGARHLSLHPISRSSLAFPAPGQSIRAGYDKAGSSPIHRSGRLPSAGFRGLRLHSRLHALPVLPAQLIVNHPDNGYDGCGQAELVGQRDGKGGSRGWQVPTGSWDLRDG